MPEQKNIDLSTHPILQGLNEPQREAVTHIDGPLLVLAAAGSGKTRVITHRIAYIMMQTGCAPWNVLAVTFTNKAAGEMRERIGGIMKSSLRGFWIGTFHSICARILRTDGKAIGVDPNFTIYDRADSMSALKRAISDMEYSVKRPKSILNKISSAKNQFEFPEDVLTKAFEEPDLQAARLYKRYQEILRENKALDFDDLLVECVRLILEVPEVAQKYQKRFQYILVDEYQDTNHPQYLLLRGLSKGHQRICVVGDDDQSIYRWRGADIRNILDFAQEYPDSKIVHLEQNYRSTQTIINAAYQLVQNNKRRHKKKIFSAGDIGEKIKVVTVSDESAEARWILDEIEKTIKEQSADYQDFALFYRTNAQSRLLEEECVKRGVPYNVVGGTAFYERKEIKDAIAYCKLLLNPSDVVSFERIVNEPKRKLGKKSVEKIVNYSSLQKIPILQAAKQVQSEEFGSGMTLAARNGFPKFANLFERWRDIGTELTLEDLARTILSESGYWSMLENSAEPEDEERLGNLEELFNACFEFQERYEPDDDVPQNGLLLLAAFLERSSLTSDQDSLENGKNKLILMTVHSAKGLEFPYVFLTGMEEGLFPHSKVLESDNPQADIEEERRLCYVGITRAKKKIHLTSASSRRMYGNSEYTTPSRFIHDIPDEFKEEINEGWRTTQSDFFNVAIDEAAEKGKKKHESFTMGDMVTHRTFGFGVIIDMQGEGGGAHITVDFQDFGKKTLVQEYARLQKV